ncbi:hypothetical protein [Prevotella sp. P5-108]|uniref:hypothetical protein n=1 Tax=Prevotella sp. P5-108 TaxID=2024225 RepID=UPI001303D978|nr:hypothetical protein [Prevotella sp. P5-108]
MFFAVFAPDCPSALRVLAAAGLPAAVGTSTLLEMTLAGAGATSASGKGKHKI